MFLIFISVVQLSYHCLLQAGILLYPNATIGTLNVGLRSLLNPALIYSREEGRKEQLVSSNRSPAAEPTALPALHLLGKHVETGFLSSWQQLAPQPWNMCV